MLVVSPWSKSGNDGKYARVSSRLSDHTSIIRFLETWLQAKGFSEETVRCNNISAWRRAVCGDLTETLNLISPSSIPSDAEVASWSIPEPLNGTAYAPYPYKDSDPFSPDVEKRDPAPCPLPYDYVVNANKVTTSKDGTTITLTFDNSKSSAAATFIVYANALTSEDASTSPPTPGQKALHFSVAAKSTLVTHPIKLANESSLCQVYGPKQPLREYFWPFK